MAQALPLSHDSRDLRLDELAAALATAEPVKVAAALFQFCEDGQTRDLLLRRGSNPGLWDILDILDQAGLRLRVEER